MPIPAHDVFREVLEQRGVEHVFGLPGTQNMALFEALRNSRVRVVVPTHELAAGFMANGYHRVSGRPSVVLSIGGPGFAYTMAAMAEAMQDSAALVHLTTLPPCDGSRRHLSQSIDQSAMALPVCKAVLAVHRADDLTTALDDALRIATGEDPGPVLVQVDPAGLDDATDHPQLDPSTLISHEIPDLEDIVRELTEARRPLFFVGQGAIPAAEELTELAEALGAPVLSTSSGRGVLPESHPLSLGFEFSGTRTEALNELVEASDLVLALGCRFSQNGARGFRLRIPREKLLHVDRSAANLGVNYPARREIHADTKFFLRAALDRMGFVGSPTDGWSAEDLEAWRARGRAESWIDAPEPWILGQSPVSFFEALREVLAEDAILVTDSGLHQFLTRRYYRVESAAGLVMPTDFQSMGFALPAAIGAQLARPERRVVALIGDGGLLMSGMELATAVKLGLSLCVLVIADGSYGLIRRSQESAYGDAPSSELPRVEFAALAHALGANHLRLGGDPEEGLRQAFELPGVTLVEIPAEDSGSMRLARAKGRIKAALPERVLKRLRRLIST